MIVLFYSAAWNIRISNYLVLHYKIYLLMKKILNQSAYVPLNNYQQ